MTPQSILVICAVVDTARLTALRALLATLNALPGMAAPDNALVPFRQISRLHFARFVIVETTTGDDIRLHGVEPKPWAPLLVFTGAAVLAELAVRAVRACEKSIPIAWISRRSTARCWHG